MDWEVSQAKRDAALSDVHSGRDERQIAIDSVGIRRLRHPISVEDHGKVQHTVAEVSLAVALPADRRGAHMSRFVAVLTERPSPLCPARMADFLDAMAARLDAQGAEAEFVFPFFLEKRAPVTGIASHVDYEVRLAGTLAGGRCSVRTAITVPVTSLCPCSKEIADYGAHNQRSHVRVEVHDAASISLRELIETIESEASAPVYGLLKRADEKYLTELAYDNPKFVEDTVRDVALRLRADERIGGFRVEVENFESIHNHSAYAALTHDL